MIQISLILLFLIFPLAAHAEEAIGKVVFVKGEATVVRPSDPNPQPLEFNAEIFQMDTLETHKGELKVLFEDQTVLSLKSQSKVLITEHVYRPNQGSRKSIFDILKGNVRTIIERAAFLRNDNVELHTPTAVAGIRGTDVGTRVVKESPTVTYFICFDGSIETWLKGNPTETLMVGPGEMTKIQDTPPTEKESIPPEMEQKFLSPPDSIEEITDQPGGEALKPAQPADTPSGEPVTETTSLASGPEPPKTEGQTIESTVMDQPPILPGATDETPPDTTSTGGGTGGGGGTTDGGGTTGGGGTTDGGGTTGGGGTTDGGSTGGGTGGTGGSTGGGGTPSSPVNVPVSFPTAG